MTDLDKYLKMLKSPMASVRYDACEQLRVATESSPEVIFALEEATQDEDESVAERARQALNADVHQQIARKMGRVSPIAEMQPQVGVEKETGRIVNNVGAHKVIRHFPPHLTWLFLWVFLALFITIPLVQKSKANLNSRSSDKYPIWSPEGKKIAFLSNRDGEWNLYVVDLDKTGVTRLAKMTYNHIDDPCISWSPDGKRIAFIDYGSMDDVNLFAREGDQLYLINSDGTGLQKLASNITGYTLRCPLKWSPDGSHLLLSAGKNETTTVEGNVVQTMVWYVLLAGIDGVPAQQPVQGCCFNWSLDGLQYLYTRGKEGGGEILLQKIAGGGPIQLAQGMTWKWGPSWSLDGTRLVFQCADTELCFTNPDGSDVRRFSLPDIVDSYVIKQLAWSPDGQQIAFIDWSDKAFLVRVDGTDFEPISDTGICSDTLQWSSDSKSILLEACTSTLDREISIVDTATGSQSVVSVGRNASISPNGQQIAFEAGDYINDEIFSVSVDGSNRQNLSNNPQEVVREKTILSALMSGLVMSTLFVFVLGLVFTLGVKIIPIFWVWFKKEEITARLILLYSLSMLMVVVSGLALFATPVFERLYNRGNWASEPGGWTLLGILMLFWIAVYFDLLWLLVVVPAAWILAAYPLAEPSYGVMGTITEFLLSPPTFEIGFAALRILNPLILITMVMIFGAILGKKIIGETLTASIVFAFIGAILSYACIFTLLMAAG